MKTSNDLTKLLHQVTRTDGSGRSGLLMPVKASNAVTSTSKSVSIGHPQGERSLTLGERVAKGVNFGSPSSSGTSRAEGGAEWANLLRQTASGGISGGLGGGGILSALGGFGGLVSSFAKVFGGEAKTEAPLIRFQLPDSQNQVVFASSHQTGSSSSQSMHDQPPQWQSAHIAEAVKQALLNSSSLNDVIAEI